LLARVPVAVPEWPVGFPVGPGLPHRFILC